jgi:hypothetical protein
MAVLEDLASGRIGIKRACWSLRHGGVSLGFPALFLLIRIHPAQGRGFVIPLWILPLWILAALGITIAQLVYWVMGKGEIPGAFPGLMILWSLQFCGRGRIVHVNSAQSDRVEIALW